MIEHTHFMKTTAVDWGMTIWLLIITTYLFWKAGKKGLKLVSGEEVKG